MKKSLIALAVMAVSGIASAQSNVTLYGIVDVWVGSAKNSAGLRQTQIGDGGLGQSRFGFKGSEDLGGGLKANFVLEQGFEVDRGIAGNWLGSSVTTPTPTGTQMFSRVSYVGFTGGFGEVRLGKTYTAFDDISGAAHPAFDSAFSPTAVWASTGYKWSPGNTFYYATPEMGGFSGAASYSIGEDKTNVLSPGNIASFHVKYNGGPLYVGLGYQREKTRGAATRANFIRLNATYDFGAAKLLVGYGRTNAPVLGAGASRATDWSIGADVPLSTAAKVSFGYARSTDNGVFGGGRGNGLSLAGIYSLSKRTDLYAGISRIQAREDNRSSYSKGSLYAVGVRHSF